MQLKKNKIILILILGISLIYYFWPLWKYDFYESMDGELHLGRVGAYSYEFRQGQFPVRWSSKLNYGYGSPIFNFVYPLPYFIASLLNLSGFSIALSLKILIFLAWMSSAYFMFLALRQWKFSKTISLIGSLVYVLLPYRIMDVYVRLALGEHLAFSFAPLLWYAILVWIKGKKPLGLVLIVISAFLLILSHNALSIMFLVLLGTMAIMESKIRKVNKWLPALMAMFWGLLCSAFFWLPSLWEMKYTLTQHFLKDKDYHDYFSNLIQVWWRPWSFSNTITPTFLGLSALLIFLISIYLAIKFKYKRIVYLLILLIISLFITTPLSVIIWENIDLIQYFQTPWRFLSLSVFLISLLTAFVIKHFSKTSFLMILILALLIIETMPKIKVLKPIQVDNAYYKNYPLSTTWHHEGAPIWTAGEDTAFPLSRFEMIPEQIFLLDQDRSLTKKLKFENQFDSRLIFKHYYFPGWKAYLDGNLIDIQFQDPAYRGLITLNIPKGDHELTIIFTKTRIRMLAEIISLASIISLTVFFVGINLKSKIYDIDKNKKK